MLILFLATWLMAQTPKTLWPVRIYGSLQFSFYGNNIFAIEGYKIYTKIFSKLYVNQTTPCVNAQQCNIYLEGIMDFYPALGLTQKFMSIKFKVLTDVPPRYAALKNMLGPLAEKLFIMCVLPPRPELAAKTVAGSVARFLSYNMRTFYFFAVAPYNIWLKPGETVTLTYFISTSPTDVSLFARRMFGNQPCPWGDVYHAEIPVVYNVGGITGVSMSWGWSVSRAIKPTGYWDFPKSVYYVFNVKGTVKYPNKGTYSPNRGPSGLITVPPMIVRVGYNAYPVAPYTVKLPGSYVGAVMQSFEVSFARKCPGDVDLDGKYTMKDFNVVGCLSGVITNKTFCNNLLAQIPPQLKSMFAMTGDVNQNGAIDQMDAMVLLDWVGTKCPAADYAKLANELFGR